MNREYNTIFDIYYGTSDTKFERFFAYNNQLVKKTERFVGIIGGLACLNFITLLKPKEMILCDINPFAIIYAKLILRLIKLCPNKEEFFNTLKNKSYEVENESEAYLKSNLYYVGAAEPTSDSGPDWTIEIPGAVKAHNQHLNKTGVQLRHPKASWKYAMDNYQILKEIIQDSKIEYKTIDCFSSEFNELIDVENTWTWLSNIDTIGFKKQHFKSMAFLLTQKNCVLTTEMADSFIVNHGKNKWTKTCTDVVCGKGKWRSKPIIKIL